MAVAAARKAHGPPVGVGVLDPACGSGTFLFHAARRVCEFAASWTPQQQADFTSWLVCGFDIHPVAVEIARATLMRALPIIPSEGVDGLRVFQGDSLATPTSTDQGSLLRGLGVIQFLTPKQREIQIPLAFALAPNVGQRLRHLIDSCLNDEDMPPYLLEKLTDADRTCLKTSHERLTNVIKDEGDGVWLWFMKNHISTAILAEKKVDRIVANPPWVRMSELQVKERRIAFEAMVADADLYPKGQSRSIVGTTGSFDIAALFVIRCEDIYLSPSRSAAGWVVNRASLTADNWLSFRDQRTSATRYDLSEMRPQPFSGAKSAIWFTGQGGTGKQFLLCLQEGERMKRTDEWAAVRPKVSEIEVRTSFPKEPSGYVIGNRASAHAGANLRPHCLVVIEEHTPTFAGFSEVVTRESKQKPWNGAGTVREEVPDSWIVEAIFSQNLLVGCFTSEWTQCVVPMDELGGLESTPDGAFWDEAQDRYTSFKGKGSTTPKQLIDYLDYQGRLTGQLESESLWRIVYNKSGKYLRSARTNVPRVLNDNCYWMTVQGEEEATYLVAVLNADTLQAAYRSSCGSDRDFHTLPWFCVPIPRFDPGEALHQDLAKLGADLEKIARKVRDRPELQGAGQIKVCTEIRKALRTDGLSSRLDQSVLRLLPDHATA